MAWPGVQPGGRDAKAAQTAGGLATRSATPCLEVMRAGAARRRQPRRLGDRSCATGTDAQRTSGLGSPCSPVWPQSLRSFLRKGRSCILLLGRNNEMRHVFSSPGAGTVRGDLCALPPVLQGPGRGCGRQVRPSSFGISAPLGFQSQSRALSFVSHPHILRSKRADIFMETKRKAKRPQFPPFSSKQEWEGVWVFSPLWIVRRNLEVQLRFYIFFWTRFPTSQSWHHAKVSLWFTYL